MKIVYIESFGTFDEAQYYMETILMANSGKHIHEAVLQFVNQRWQAAMIFSDPQMELDI